MRRSAAVFAAGTLALMIKHLTLPLVWCLFVYEGRARRAALWLAAALALWALTFAPYLPDGAERIVERVILYRSWGGYGFNSPPLFYAAIALLPFAARRLALSLPDALLFTALGQMVFMYGAGSNNFYPVFALALLHPSRWLVPITAAAVVLINPWRPMEMNQPINTNNLLFIVVLPWFVWLLISRYRRIPRQRRI